MKEFCSYEYVSHAENHGEKITKTLIHYGSVKELGSWQLPSVFSCTQIDLSINDILVTW